MNWELPDVQAGFRKEKAEEPEVKLPTSVGSWKKSMIILEKLLLHWLRQSHWLLDHNKLWKIPKMGIPDHITCLLRNLYASQEGTVRTRHGTTSWFKLGKEVQQALYTFHMYIMWNAGLEELQAGIKIAGHLRSMVLGRSLAWSSNYETCQHTVFTAKILNEIIKKVRTDRKQKTFKN